MQISILPGFSTTKNLDAKFNKPQRFVLRNGLPKEENLEEKIPKIPAADRLLGRNPFKDCTAPMLTFDAFYCDPLGELNTTSTTRYRKCKLLYFLADDEIKIYEPWDKNSGLEQGCIARKARYFKPGGGYYTIDDLNIGETLTLFGREYKLTNCDAFTRNFLTEMGYKVKSPEPEIEDPIAEDRKEANVPKSYKKPYVKEYKDESFFKYHPKTLRFYGYYGSGKNLFEEKKEISLYYDLSYGTIRIVEEKSKSKWTEQNNRVILKSTRVPKVVEPSLLHGEMCNPTLLNLAHDVQSVLIGGKYYKIHNPASGLVDSNPLQGRKRKVDYYTDLDLDLGVTLKIFGSDVFLYDCDIFTKSYYRSTYNKELEPVPRPEVKPFPSHKLVYKHEVFGDPEQTLRTNDPSPPIRCMADLKKFLKNDKYAYDVRELKFIARLITEDAIQKHRIFLVRWFLEDDTMDIRALDLQFENLGIMENKYLKRMKVVKPQSSVGNFGLCYYQPTDMYVGNSIFVRGKIYYLMDADEYTYDYMERNCHLFHHSNIKRILTKLRQWCKDNANFLKSKFEKKDPLKTGFVTYDHFREVLYDLMSDNMKSLYPEHALKTLARHYADDKYIGLNLDDLSSRIRTELYRLKYYDFEDLKLALEIQDDEKTGQLTPKRLYYAMRSSSIPIKRDLLKSFIYKFPAENGNIKYLDVIKTIDWIKNNTQFEKEEPCAIQINWEQKEYETDLDKIKYNTFLSDVIL